MPRSDLSPAEQQHVRVLLRMLRAKLGTWRAVERALPLSYSSLWEVTSERAEVSATIAFRVARLLDATISQVLTGQALPPGTCKHCGHSSADEASPDGKSRGPRRGDGIVR